LENDGAARPQGHRFFTPEILRAYAVHYIETNRAIAKGIARRDKPLLSTECRRRNKQHYA